MTSKDAIKEDVKEDFSNFVIAQVNDYVNVRDLPDENEGKIIGKLYNNSVGNYIEETDNGWIKIESGNCVGYVKAEFCVTGDDAIALAEEVGTLIATVNTTTLKVREEPGLDASVIGLVPIADELTVSEKLDGWVKVDIEEGEGYVSLDYVELHTEFVTAESKEEEEARLAKEKAAREKANKAARDAAAAADAGASTAGSSAAVTASGSGAGSDVANYALQFVGNPYVYGGSSLTNGTDCSGFVMSVYGHFGVSLPHSSASDRSQGYDVGGISNAQPGDIVCYSGHVAIYIGNGQIVHASTSKTGIIVSDANYRQPICVRRIF
jgi:cell wall-associated NlpC family hydrolase